VRRSGRAVPTTAACSAFQPATASAMRRAFRRSQPGMSGPPTMSTPSWRPVAPTCACSSCPLTGDFDRGAAELVESLTQRPLLQPEAGDELACAPEIARLELAARLLVGHFQLGVAFGRFGKSEWGP